MKVPFFFSAILFLLLLGLFNSCAGEVEEEDAVQRPVTARFLEGPTLFEVKQVSDSLCRHLASAEVNLQTIDSLLEAGADPNCDCLRSRYYRKFADRIPIIRRFVKRKFREVRVYEHPLHLAAISGHAATISRLISAGADPNLRNSMEEHPLEWAIKAKEMPALLALLKEGSRAKEVDLGYATHAESIDTLIAHGADGASINLNNWLKLREPELARRMILYGADLSKVNGDKLLTFKGTELLVLCLERGMSPDQPDVFGKAMIFETIRKNHREGFELLLKAGANVEIEQNDGKNPLMYAAQLNRMEMLRRLLELGADLSHFDEAGKTPLHYAIDSRGPEPLQLLLRFKAPWPEGAESMLDYARTTKARQEIIKLLETLQQKNSFKGL